MTYRTESYEAGYARGKSDQQKGIHVYSKPDGTKYVEGYLKGQGG